MKKNTPTEKKNLDYALEYLKRGWSIIPVGRADAKGSKKLPWVTEWKEYQNRLPTEEEIRTWWAIYKDAGIALVCGKVSNVIVVDIDKGGEKHTLSLTGPTLSARSGGGGQHIFYKWRPGLVGAKVGLQTHVDIRSDGSYIILPPSLHASGNKYEWLIDDIDPIEAPPCLELSADEKTKEKTDWNEFLTQKKPEGTRNMSATQFAGKIFYETSPELWDTLGLGYFKIWNEKFNTPPLPEGELLNTWNSIKKLHVASLAPATAVYEGEPAEPHLNPQEEEELIFKSFVKNKTIGTYNLAHYLTKKYNIITVGEAEREMFVYRDGKYFRAENEIIYPEIQRILKYHVTKSAKLETFHKIADLTAQPRDIFTSADPKYIPLKNGVYNFETRELLPHSSEYHFTYQMPIIYDAAADCPKTKIFLDQVLTENQRQTVEEWMGYYFYRLYIFKKAIIFVGEGDTGKTTLLEVITHLLGRENISSVSLQKMGGDKFSAAHLYEKHGNLVDELSAKDISDTGHFKIATGGGSITGEYKFGNQFSFLNFSKFTFACNKIPDVKDFDDEAYFNRWMVVRFEKKIEKKIPNFIATLTTEEERSGLFNLAMTGLERLMKQGMFSYGLSPMDTKKEMMRSGSSIAMFAAEKVVQETGAEIGKDDMYEAYTTFCAERGIPAETIKMFGSKFLFYVGYASEGLINDLTPSGKSVARVRGWRNVKVLPSGEMKLADELAEDALKAFE